MDRRELADFLRSRRERIAPADVGLPAGTRRRTPGLRREEAAQLAGISPEYWSRLEQARAPRPSPAVLLGITRALRLDDAERDHLHLLAGSPPVRPTGPRIDVRPSLLDLVAHLPHAAALVVSATYEVLAWNPLAAALMEDFSALEPRERNLLRRAFLDPGPGGRRLYGVGDADAFARTTAHHLRSVAARYPDDPGVQALVGDLVRDSEEFRALWVSHDVGAQPRLCTTFAHPSVGPVTVSCDALQVADRDQQVLIYTAEPGTPSAEAMRLLAVIGTQHMGASSPAAP